MIQTLIWLWRSIECISSAHHKNTHNSLLTCTSDQLKPTFFIFSSTADKPAISPFLPECTLLVSPLNVCNRWLVRELRLWRLELIAPISSSISCWLCTVTDIHLPEAVGHLFGVIADGRRSRMNSYIKHHKPVTNMLDVSISLELLPNTVSRKL